MITSMLCVGWACFDLIRRFRRMNKARDEVEEALAEVNTDIRARRYVRNIEEVKEEVKEEEEPQEDDDKKTAEGWMSWARGLWAKRLNLSRSSSVSSESERNRTDIDVFTEKEKTEITAGIFQERGIERIRDAKRTEEAKTESKREVESSIPIPRSFAFPPLDTLPKVQETTRASTILRNMIRDIEERTNPSKLQLTEEKTLIQYPENILELRELFKELITKLFPENERIMSRTEELFRFVIDAYVHEADRLFEKSKWLDVTTPISFQGVRHDLSIRLGFNITSTIMLSRLNNIKAWMESQHDKIKLKVIVHKETHSISILHFLLFAFFLSSRAISSISQSDSVFNENGVSGIARDFLHYDVEDLIIGFSALRISK